ncbi:MAG: hypothetical protein R3B90_02275 [Planctomycetaceae bacterium]
MTPRLPQPQDVEAPPTAGERNYATCLAVLALAMATAGLAFLIGMIIPTAFYVLLLIAVLGGIFALHYLTWGWLLSATTKDIRPRQNGSGKGRARNGECRMSVSPGSKPDVTLSHLPIVKRLFQFLLWLWASPATLVGLSLGTLGLLTGGTGRSTHGAIEFSGGLVTWFLRHIGRRAAAMTLGHTILGRSSDDLNAAREHEHVHVRQYELWGPLFLPAYGLCALWLQLRGRHGYWDNPFEREAYDHCAHTQLAKARDATCEAEHRDEPSGPGREDDRTAPPANTDDPTA